MWISIAILLVSLIVSYAVQPKPAVPKPAALSDFDFPQSTEGTPQAIVFGDVWISGWMVLGTGNFRTTPIKS